MLTTREMALMLASFIVAAAAAFGQTTTSALPPAATKNVYRRSTLDERVKRFAKVLDLDGAQQTALKTVMERQQEQAMQIRLDASLSGADRIGRLRALQQDTVRKIRGLLNEEQKKKYDPQNHQSEGNSDSYMNDWLKTPQH